MTSAPAIGFEYRPSRWPGRLFVIIGALAVLAVMECGMPVWMRMFLALGVLTTCIHAIRQMRSPVVAAGWSRASGWSLRSADGTDDPAVLLSFKVAGSWVLLRLKSSRYGTLTLWLMPDNSDADIRRRLRMRLAVLRLSAEENTA